MIYKNLIKSFSGILIFFFSLCSLSVQAAPFKIGDKKNIDGIEYIITSPSDAAVCNIYKNQPNIVIPETVEIDGAIFTVREIYCDTSEIDWKKRNNLYLVERITLPATLTSIGSSAFQSLLGLRIIDFQAALHIIGDGAFLNCGIEELLFPQTIDSIGASMFMKTPNLKTVVYPEDLESYGTGQFVDCNSLENVTLPLALKTLIHGTFFKCPSLKTLIIPSGVEKIEGEAFKNSKVKTLVVLGEPYIDPNAFISTPVNTIVSSPDIYDEIKNQFAIAPRFIDIKDSEYASLAQSSNRFPIINISRIEFDDESGMLETKESSYLNIYVENSGFGPAKNCTATLALDGYSDVSFPPVVPLPKIAVGDTEVVSVRVTGGGNLDAGSVTFNVALDEPNGFGCDPVPFTIKTDKLRRPEIGVKYYRVNNERGGTIEKRKAFDLFIVLENKGGLASEGSQISLDRPDNVYLMEGSEKETIGRLDPGEGVGLNYKIIVNNNYTADQLYLNFLVIDNLGVYADPVEVIIPFAGTAAAEIAASVDNTSANYDSGYSASAESAPSTPIKTNISAGATETVYHEVKKGETLGSIAKQYNVTVEEIINWNFLSPKLTASSKPGEEQLILYVPIQ